MTNGDPGTAARLRLLSSLLLLGVFVAGALAGIGVCRWLTPSPPQFRPPPRAEMVRELGLDAAQAERWREIDERHRPELEAIVAESKPRVRKIIDTMDAERRALLTPAQQGRFDELKARMPPGGPPMGGRPFGGPPPGGPPPFGGPPPGGGRWHG
jgi:hypothetical protein